MIYAPFKKLFPAPIGLDRSTATRYPQYVPGRNDQISQRTFAHFRPRAHVRAQRPVLPDQLRTRCFAACSRV